MVDNMKLEPGRVVEADGKTYLLKSVRTLGFTAIDLDGIPISCKYCGGNLQKMGTRKGQYKCLECKRPNWLDSEGEHEEA
ncbi:MULTISPECIES: hypothetical protein [Methanobacterium]|uniref:Uncharacterized protein n=1 Tax=Methanobacterium bryantii TaxID=2161 RepID=A0A2A2H8H3_METBR|nr:MULTISPECIES: hypothetical protein [Methanobacterium]OEC87862.1 hypothetical protein A9507_06720 [Methanobacterium sp. A39]PAV05729.1 hypothetical protein ASJ80_08330 [Methanobacterium bryantii]